MTPVVSTTFSVLLAQCGPKGEAHSTLFEEPLWPLLQLIFCASCFETTVWRCMAEGLVGGEVFGQL